MGIAELQKSGAKNRSFLRFLLLVFFGFSTMKNSQKPQKQPLK